MLENKYKNHSSIYEYYPSFFLIKKDYHLHNKKVIDLGCSDGRYLKHFWKNSIGIEYSDVDREKAEKEWLHVIFGNLNKEFDFCQNEKFDFIFSSHVIEHLESPYLFLKRIRNFWWNNAKLILWYPIENSLVRLFDPYFWHDGHVYSFSLANIKKLFQETWFEIEKIYYDIPFAWKWKIFNRIQKIVQKLPYRLVGWRSNALYLVARKI